MKRSFLFSAIVALAVVLVGCNDNKPTGDGDYTSISFKESAITMICGDTTNLSLLYQPATLSRPNAEWSSADTALVKVIGKGIIVAASDTIGTTTVTAKVNDLVATCEVTVDTYRNLIGFGNIICLKGEAVGDVKDTTLKNGKTYKIQFEKCPILMIDNLGFDSNTGAGSGYAILDSTMLYVITEGDYKGYMFSNFGAIFREDSLDQEYAALVGNYDPTIVGPAWEKYLTTPVTTEEEDEKAYDEFIAEYEKGVTGAQVVAASSSDGNSWRWSSISYGTVTDGYFVEYYDDEDNLAIQYDVEVEWLNYVGYGLGLAIDWDASMEEDSVIIKKPYTKDCELKHYTSNSAVQAMPSLVKSNNALNSAKLNNTVFELKGQKLQVMPREALR